ncbi:membrane protein [Gracilibacillus sp. YIM 98692]|uniref:YczE/YyaS/YitT family protein n=1 Tax=Gracilibacillus sp. YIM 98692 TaxID=2663532 RepID=UPI0013D629AD|nr:membrane protein [Gracilibacillus sp. YIM 98692]
MNKINWRRFYMMLIGNLFIGIAVTLLRISTLGTDPFSTMNLGVSSFINMSFGLYQLVINIVLLGFIFLYARYSIGLGTLVNMVGIGFISDFLVYSYSLFFDDISLLAIRIIIVAIAVIFASMGVALYITPNLGMAPYDALAFVIEKLSKNKIPFPVARITTDMTCVLIGFSFGAIVGIATVIMAFFTGPFVQFFRKHVAEPMLEKDRPIQVQPIPAHK